MGSILGAHLARAGHSVAMIAREPRASRIETDGLRIRGLSDFSASVFVLRDASELTAADVFIVAMKTPGTAQALGTVRADAIGTAFSVQNGPLKNDLLADAFGKERILGALADTSGEMLANGEVMFTRNVNIRLGELSGGASARAVRIAEIIDASGVRATAAANILSLEWSKFAAWIGLMTLSVTTRAFTWQFLLDPGSALVLARLLREMGRLARALNIDLTDDAVLPVATMCRGSDSDAVEILTKAGREFAKAPQHRMSALQDLLGGRPLEVHETLGYAAHRAAELGLSLPLLESFYQLVAAIDRTR
jgi:2-dehydropantoate 2-reductase